MAYEDTLKSLRIKQNLKTGSLVVDSTTTLTGVPTLSATPLWGSETLTASGTALSTVLLTQVNLDAIKLHANTIALTLANGIVGQRKIIQGFATTGTGIITVTPTKAANFTLATSLLWLTALTAPRPLEMIYTGSGWLTVGTGTAATAGWTFT